MLQLGNAYLDGSDLRARSLRWAESLAQRAGEAVWVATLSGSRVIVHESVHEEFIARFDKATRQAVSSSCTDSACIPTP